MLHGEIQELEEIKGLVSKGQQQGVLSYSEIADAVSEVDLDEADVEELYGFLEKSEIELVEEIETVPAARPRPSAPIPEASPQGQRADRPSP